MTPPRVENSGAAMTDVYPTVPTTIVDAGDGRAKARPYRDGRPRPPRRRPCAARRVRLLADRWAVQIDAYTWRRYALIEPLPAVRSDQRAQHRHRRRRRDACACCGAATG